MVDSLSYLTVEPVLHDWYNKDHGMCYLVCQKMYIKEQLLQIGISTPYSGGSMFPLSLSELSFTICLTPYNGN